ncbi:SMP-30/gluconolactonase/LRE family protein [Calidifontimicrobium sp. SYSU G02091]|jgi:sugar lactone lactonase YvrE|uniref:SMP-30/gluconolactonase/LRE family protein n=1 Tax=Calidifontimicrobium sp. SYSU G02091 TaxID=2926421 RepID=UPI001F52DB5F|nr:SMP-30/gluconolactonase/LRE family protein [Calidifontimicrobium sp. SYSU G02091]MCI1191744.1 SMP-30/gluconolactonase/LRE family protein [Calidifontimicrobium sp. SYSU G02091]
MSIANPLDGFEVDRAAIRTIGRDLQRPECILAERDGTLWAADARGGVMRIAPDGAQQFVGQRVDERFATAAADTADAFEAKFTQGTLPNGLAFAADGSILIANFGTDRLELMTRDGRTRTLYDRIDGQPIGKVNFVLRDSKQRLWLTVSTRVNPWTKAAATRVRDGYIAVVDEHGLRVVADGFHFTNEVRLDAAEQWLYIVETTGPHITRMRLDERADGVRLVDREVFGPSHLGGYPDGIAFDAHGNLWCTLVMVDKLVALTPQGDLRVLLDDGDPDASRHLLAKMAAGEVSADDMARARGTIAPWMASITFGGPDLRTVYVGSLLGTTIPYFRSPVPGLPMVHWHERP